MTAVHWSQHQWTHTLLPRGGCFLRSDDSRTVRWTVHLTAKEFNLLELLRSDWKESGGLPAPVKSRAELLLTLVDWLMFDDPKVAALPRVAEAYEQVQRELRLTDYHTDRGGRKPHTRLREAEDST